MVLGRTVLDRVEGASTADDKDRTRDDDPLEAADLGNDAGGADEDDDLDENEGEELDAGDGGGAVVDRLVREGEVVDFKHEGGKEGEEDN